MICQNCGQRPASLHYTKIVNGAKTELHLCEECAKEQGEFSETEHSFMSAAGGYTIQDLLSDLLNMDQSNTAGNAEKKQPKKAARPLTCDNCGLTYKQFTKTGRLGCAHCYHAFESKLTPVFRRVHSGNTNHTGKVPKHRHEKLHAQRELDEKKRQITILVQNEEFEKAAELRDEIRTLEKQFQGREEDS